MKTQIFKNNVPKEIVFNILEKINSFKSNKYYTINNLSFKKGIYANDISEFMQEIKPYYHNSKQFYVDREMTFPRFTTVVRQICKANDIPFTSQIKYDKSKYNIEYNVYFS